MALSLVPDDTLGAAMIGFFLSCVVFGIFTTQVFIYFRRYFEDRLIYKLLVTGLWIIELVDQIFIGYSIFYYAVTHFADPTVLVGDAIWTLVVQLVVGCLVGTIVKICFAMRVWRFSKQNVYITGAIVLMILGQFGIALLYCVKGRATFHSGATELLINTFLRFEFRKLTSVPKLRLVGSLSLGTGVITDFAIAVALCYFLRKLRTGFHKSDTLVNTLSIYAINTGVLTATIGLLTLVLYNARPDTFFFMAPYFTLGKMYTISFLATLNTRKVIRGRGTDRAGSSTGNTSGGRNTFLMVTNSGRKPRVPEYYSQQQKSMEVGVHQEVSVTTDADTYDTARTLPQREVGSAV